MVLQQDQLIYNYDGSTDTWKMGLNINAKIYLIIIIAFIV